MNTRRFKNREEAGSLLSERLVEYRDTNSVVVGISRGGVCVASAIARQLMLPLEVLPGRKMKHPADKSKSIGSVTAEDVFIHDCPRTVPREYIARQIISLRSAIRRENDVYYGNTEPDPFLFKNVILVDEALQSIDSIMASIASIRRQSPAKIVVAVPVLTPEAERIIRTEVDEVIYLDKEHVMLPPRDYFVEFPKVTEEQIRQLLVGSRKTRGSGKIKQRQSILW